ncbi:MAG: trypsin-like peptidase domain-containing protein [Ruminococcus sp.]|nr:trypsin-like peptidase domain-containing protein [Ruminococcus sp.]
MKLKRKLASFVVAGFIAVVSCGSLASSASSQHLKYDANGDGEVGLADAVYVRQYLSGCFDPKNLDFCDVDRNGIVSLMDAEKIEYHCIGLLEENDYYVNDNNTNTVNSNLTYYVYDSKIGGKNKKYDYTLSPLESYSKSRTMGVFGKDDRKKDPTCNGVVSINCVGTGYGTGFIIDDHVIATAAHCLYNRDTHEAIAIDKISVLGSTGNIKFDMTPVESHIPEQFMADSNKNYDYDYALITVKEDLSSFPHFEIGAASNAAVGQKLKISGFPGSVNDEIVNGDAEAPVIYTGEGYITKMDDIRILTNIDATEGNSGSPMYIEENIKIGKDEVSYKTAVSVFSSTFGIEELGITYDNRGVRFTTDHIHFYKANPNIKW